MTDVEHVEARHDPALERQIAETMADRERSTRRYSEAEIRHRSERRERIATAVLPILADDTNKGYVREICADALEWAEVLMDALARAEERDRNRKAAP